jgi:arabinose-5-phosphate isomerase
LDKSLIEIAKTVIQTETDSILKLKNRIDNNFVKACQLLVSCQGKVIVIGMGKSGHIGRKIAATLASTGTPAFFVHPGEAGHGDLGMVNANDVLIVISYSGKSDEITTLLPAIKQLSIPILAMTGNKKSIIAKAANIHLDVSVEQEACPHNLTPTSSTTTALVMGDAIAITLLNARGFTPEDFAKSHPSGTLGRRILTLVSSIMKIGDDIPLVVKETPLVKSILMMSQKSLGMVIITDNEYSLQGIFTDGDLRRVLEKNSNIQDLLIKDVMTSDCKSIGPDKPALLAFHMMDENRLNSLPVVDANNQVIGAINMHTLMKAKVV